MLDKKQCICFTVLGAMLISLAITGCAAKKAAWGDPEAGLILKYAIEPGQALNYKRNTESTQSMEMMGQSMKTTSNTGVDYIVKGVGSDDQNNIKTQVTINDLTVSTDSPMVKSPDTSALKGKSFGITFSPKGKETGFTGIDELPKISAGQPNAQPQSVKSYFLNVLPELPADNIKIGDTWVTPIENVRKQGPLELTIKGETTNLVDGLETVQGMECIRIKTNSKNTIEGSGNTMGQDIKISGNTKASSTWYFAFKKGIFVKASLEEDINMKIKMGAMGEMPQTTKSKTTLKLVQ